MAGSPNQTPSSVASEFAVLQFIINQMLNGVATATLVRVKACTNDGGLTPVGTVDVQLLVDQVTGDNVTVPQGTVFKVPYMRMQGGVNAVILDPQENDIGFCVFASRDISPIKADPAAARDRRPSPGAPPGSARRFSLADAIYVGGVLNGVPTQYVQFTSSGINVVSPQTITLQAPSITLDGAVTATSTIDAAQEIHSDVEVSAANIGLTTHKHPTAPLGPVSPPIP